MEDEANLSNKDSTLSVSLLNPDVQDQDVLMDEEQQQQQSWNKGEQQPSHFRDLPFAGIFVVQLLLIIVIAFKWGIPALSYSVPESTETIRFSGILYITLLSGLAAFAMSTVALVFMTSFAKLLVEISILISMFSSLLMVALLAIQGLVWGTVMALLFFAISACYAYSIWHRIPFAASNLVTALTAVRTNLGVALVAYGLVVLAYAWIILWTMSVVGVYVRTGDCHDGVCNGHMNAAVVILFLLSFYWTQAVIANVIHVTVAGVVGSWWLVPEEASAVWSKSIGDSFTRSVTTSFGSICMGSLLVALIQVLRTLVENVRRSSQREGILMCILDCLLDFFERVAKYFNRWAFIYVGLYGYSYLEAGSRVFTLFQDRGWTTIINDDLVSRVLTIMSLVVAGLTGCIGLALGAAHKSWISEFPDDEALGAAFLCAFLVGFVVASILMSVVASAVDTVIVCFAEVPFEFQTNHPALSQEMSDAWRRVYPDEFNYF